MSFSDDEAGARRKKPAALGRDDEVLAARRSLAVVVSAQERRRGDGRSSSGVRGSDVDKVRGGMECHAFSDGAIGGARSQQRRPDQERRLARGSAALARSSCRLSVSWRGDAKGAAAS